VDHGHNWVIPGTSVDVPGRHWVGWGDLGGIYGRDTVWSLPGIACCWRRWPWCRGHWASASRSIHSSWASDVLAAPGPAMLALGSSCLVASTPWPRTWVWAADSESSSAGWRQWSSSRSWPCGDTRRTCWRWRLPCTRSSAPSRQVEPGRLAVGCGHRDPAPRRAHVPLAFSITPRGQRLRACVYGALPSVVLLAPPLLSNWQTTSNRLFHQANSTVLDHATPWIALAHD